MCFRFLLARILLFVFMAFIAFVATNTIQYIYFEIVKYWIPFSAVKSYSSTRDIFPGPRAANTIPSPTARAVLGVLSRCTHTPIREWYRVYLRWRRRDAGVHFKTIYFAQTCDSESDKTLRRRADEDVVTRSVRVGTTWIFRRVTTVYVHETLVPDVTVRKYAVFPVSRITRRLHVRSSGFRRKWRW